MKQIKVTPAAGRLVPDPERNDTVPEKGRSVRYNQYWARRVADGDVVIKKENQATTKTVVAKGEV